MTEPSRSMWSPTTPNFPVAWDSTMLGTLKECPRKWWFAHVLGYTTRGASMHLDFGRYYHAALERYDHAIATGSDHDTATRDMVRWALENTGEYRECSFCTGVGVHSGTETDCVYPPQKVTNSCSWCHGTGSVWTPWETGDPNKNRYTLIRSIVWCVENFRDLPFDTVLLTNGKPAVELSFNFDAFEIAGETVTLCGHMDKLVRQQATGHIYVADHKTTKGALSDQFYRQFSPHNQFSLYTIAGKITLGEKCDGVLVTAAQIGATFTRFGQRPIGRAQAVLDEWLLDTRYWITQAREFALADHWPANDKSCGNYGGCPFTSVCSVSPSHRQAWLDNDFVAWTWDPLKVRGDI